MEFLLNAWPAWANRVKVYIISDTVVVIYLLLLSLAVLGLWTKGGTVKM